MIRYLIALFALAGCSQERVEPSPDREARQIAVNTAANQRALDEALSHPKIEWPETRKELIDIKSDDPRQKCNPHGNDGAYLICLSTLYEKHPNLYKKWIAEFNSRYE